MKPPAPPCPRHVGPAGGECVDLVEEEDAGPRFPPRLLEQLVEVSFAVAQPHARALHGSRRPNEPGVDLARGLARARCVLPQPGGPYIRMPPPIAFPVRPVQFGVAQRVNDLEPDLFLDGLHSPHVGERDRLSLALRGAITGRRTLLSTRERDRHVGRLGRCSEEIREPGIGGSRVERDREPVGGTRAFEVALVQEQSAPQ